MISMPSTSRDFVGMADSIAEAFFRKGEPLVDGIVRIADRDDLSPEEIRRLVEKTNTAAALKLLRGDGDKSRTFELADYNEVLDKTHGPEPEEEPEAYSGIPDTRSDEDEVDDVDDADEEDDDGEEKTAALGVNGFTPSAQQVFAMQHAYDAALREKLACEMDARSRLEYMCERFSRRREAFPKFAGDSLVVCGEFARPILTGLAEYVGADTKFTKTAGIVDDRAADMQNMSALCDTMAKLAQWDRDTNDLHRALEWVKSAAYRPKEV